MREKRSLTGFSLLELIVVLVIISIAAVLALPNMHASIEQQRERNAKMQLLAIYNAQNRYKLNNDKYYSGSDVREISRELAVLIDDQHFDFNISLDAVHGYNATAVRKKAWKANQHVVLSINNASSKAEKGLVVR